MADAGTWPTAKFKEYLDTSHELESAAVVLCVDSLNPVHRGHIDLVQQGRERLERAGFTCLGGWLAVAEAAAAPAKKGLAALAASKAEAAPPCKMSRELRLHLAQLAVREDDFIAVGTATGLRDSVETAKALQDHLQKGFGDRLPPNGVKVFVVCGPDNLHLHRGCNGLIVVPKLASDILLEDRGRLHFVADCGSYRALTSSKVAYAILGGDHVFVRDSVHSEAADFMAGAASSIGSCAVAPEMAKLWQGSGDATWPCRKVMQHIEECDPDGSHVLLVAHPKMASTVPLQAHVAMLQRARERVERSGHQVIGAWLLHLQQLPGGAEAASLSAGFRRHLAELTASEDEFLEVASLEVLPDEGASAVLSSLLNSMQRYFPGILANKDVRAFCVGSGDDLGSATAQSSIVMHSGNGVVVVPTDPDDIVMEKPNQSIFAADVLDSPTLIGTGELQAAMKAGDKQKVTLALAPAAASGVLTPSSKDLLAFRSDFSWLGVEAPSTEALQRDQLKGMLRDWASPAGSIQAEELVRLMLFLDPSWSSDELRTFTNSVIKRTGEGVRPEDFVDYIFEAC